MAEKVLFVDDESAILQGYVRLFRNEFEIDTSVTGKGALIAIETKGPYAVVVSDMQMPEMSGVEVLRKVRELSPDSVRIILTLSSAKFQRASTALIKRDLRVSS